MNRYRIDIEIFEGRGGELIKEGGRLLSQRLFWKKRASVPGCIWGTARRATSQASGFAIRERQASSAPGFWGACTAPFRP